MICILNTLMFFMQDMPAQTHGAIPEFRGIRAHTKGRIATEKMREPFSEDFGMKEDRLNADQDVWTP